MSRDWSFNYGSQRRGCDVGVVIQYWVTMFDSITLATTGSGCSSDRLGLKRLQFDFLPCGRHVVNCSSGLGLHVHRRIHFDFHRQRILPPRERRDLVARIINKREMFLWYMLIPSFHSPRRGLIALMLRIPPVFTAALRSAGFCADRCLQPLNQSFTLGRRKPTPGVILRRHRSLAHGLPGFVSFFLPPAPFRKVQFSATVVDVPINQP